MLTCLDSLGKTGRRNCCPSMSCPAWRAFIGRLQTNKSKIIDKVSLIHSLDRWSLALEISRAACEKGLTARVLVQVNASGEKTKSGLHLQEVEEFVTEASRLPGLEICGLMTIAPWTENQEDVRPVFRQVRDLSLRLQHNLKARMDCLSMGMSGDYEVALEEGANVLRTERQFLAGGFKKTLVKKVWILLKKRLSIKGM